MSDTDTDSSPWSKGKLAPALVAAILLLAAGAGGGRFLGFVIVPEECATCEVELATCSVRLELVAEALGEAKSALEELRQECRP